MYAQYHADFPPPSNRPRSTLYILDRSMDLVSPLIHEFTYQAMVHDLLPVRDGEKVTYKMKVNEGQATEEVKDVELSEKDKLWVDNRHKHMKDTIDKLMGDFQKFIDANPHFANKEADGGNSLSAIKDMLAGLPQFQEMKEAYSLHLTMAQDAMNIFQGRKLPDLASVEQVRKACVRRSTERADQATVPGDRLRRRSQETERTSGPNRPDVGRRERGPSGPPSSDLAIRAPQGRHFGERHPETHSARAAIDDGQRRGQESRPAGSSGDAGVEGPATRDRAAV